MTGGVTITAVTGRGNGRSEISNIIVPQDTAGYTQAPPYKKMGWRASDTRELHFDNAAVPEEHLLGERGRGFKQFLEILDGGRISVGALSVGLAQACYGAAARTRRSAIQFGQPIAKFQADAVPARRHGCRNRARALCRAQGGLAQGPRTGFRHRGGDGEALLGRGLAALRECRGADSRRLRVHGRVSGLAVLAGLQDQRDRRRARTKCSAW